MVSDLTAGAPDTPFDAPLATPEELPQRSRPQDRVLAALEILLCSGFPTQLALIYMMSVFGFSQANRGLSIEFVAPLLLLDAALVMVLVLALLRLHGENVRQIFIGHRPIGREALLGVFITFVVFGIVIVVLTLVQRFAPWLHNVPVNPLEGLIRTARDAIVFAVVATLAGGLREEMQRAFVLRRFERHLGGARVGLVIFSVMFGAGHALQGWDAAITTGALGAYWGAVYLRRGSIVAPVVSHSVFNAAEIVRFAVWGA
jgi:membrane protease YdiL (CAAX protease family)